MAKIRNTAPDARDIPLAGRVVESGDDFEVDDDVFDQHEWPEDLYKVIVAPERRKPQTDAEKEAAKAKRAAARKAAAAKKAEEQAAAAAVAAAAEKNEDPLPDGSDDQPGSGEED